MPQVTTSCFIAAPPEDVWATLTDVARNDEWNPTVTKLRGRFEPGEDLAFKLRLGRATLPIRARVVRADGHELRWEGPQSRPARALARVSHYFRVEPEGDGTRFVHGETFDGPLCAPMGIALGRIDEAYTALNDALRRRVERRV